MRAGSAALGDVALTDAGAGANPFVVGGDHFLKVGVCEHLGGNVAGDAGDFSRDAVRHDSPSGLVQTRRIRNSMRCGCEVTRRERRNKETRWRAGGGQSGSKLRATDHSKGGRISCRQVSEAVFWSMAETEQYFFSLSSMARFTAASSSRPRSR